MLINLFHYYYVETKKSRYSDIFKRNDYTSKVVKYSLSGYYIYTYCEHYRLEHCLKNIVNYSPLSYPKAGLLYIADFEHYYNIFTASINDFDLINFLIYMGANTEIKNKIPTRGSEIIIASKNKSVNPVSKKVMTLKANIPACFNSLFKK